jgi:hypothetical protein
LGQPGHCQPASDEGPLECAAMDRR